MSHDSTTFVDHYNVLGISIKSAAQSDYCNNDNHSKSNVKDLPGSTTENLEVSLPSLRDISQAYRRLALRFHPDKLLHQKLSKEAITQAAERFDQISKSYSVLQDETLRAEFDASFLRHRRDKIRQEQMTKQVRQMEKVLLEKERVAQHERIRKRDYETQETNTLMWIQEQDRLTKRKMHDVFTTEKQTVKGRGNKNHDKVSNMDAYRELFLTHEEDILAVVTKG